MNELEKIDMDSHEPRIIQIAFSCVLLKHEENFKNVSLTSKVYNPLSEILQVQPVTVESNISNALKRHWTLADSKTLRKIEENYKGPVSVKNGAPTPKDFLVYMVEQSIKAENQKTIQKEKHLFKFPKRLIN